MRARNDAGMTCRVGLTWLCRRLRRSLKTTLRTGARLRPISAVEPKPRAGSRKPLPDGSITLLLVGSMPLLSAQPRKAPRIVEMASTRAHAGMPLLNVLETPPLLAAAGTPHQPVPEETPRPPVAGGTLPLPEEMPHQPVVDGRAPLHGVDGTLPLLGEMPRLPVVEADGTRLPHAHRVDGMPLLPGIRRAHAGTRWMPPLDGPLE